MKRLFLFASYDKFKRVDATLTYYLNSLAKLGDIVFVSDTDLPKDELTKITKIPNVLYASAVRHGEYDFGSYKRGYIWARDNKLLKKYDWVYLVNDSVFGPLGNLEPMLEKMETSGADFTGIVSAVMPRHVQSWFVGLSRQVAQSDAFDTFICNVRPQPDKSLIILKYEVRLSLILLSHNFKMFSLFEDPDADIYKNPEKPLASGFPFLKKASRYQFNRLTNLYPYTDDNIVDDILNYAKRYGIFTHCDKYIKINCFTLFAIPIFSVFKRSSKYHTNISYKVYLFNFLPICKFSRHN